VDLWIARRVALALVLVAPLSSGQTQEQRAAEHDRQAREAFQKGDYVRAAEHFDDADRLAPYPELRYNAALAWERARALARAADAYESALRRGGLEAEREQKARANLATLKERLAYVRVLGPVGGTVTGAHLERAPIPANFHLVPGEHELTIEAPDGTSHARKLALRAGEVFTVEPVSEPTEPASAPSASPPAARAPVAVETRGGSSRATWGFVLLGGSAAFAAGAVYFGLETERARDDFEGSRYESSDIRARGVRYRALTNVALGASVVCAGLGVYLLLAAESDTPVAIAVTPARASATLSF
jgi:tetratricopeptide (TPR) repeat protein